MSSTVSYMNWTENISKSRDTQQRYVIKFRLIVFKMTAQITQNKPRNQNFQKLSWDPENPKNCQNQMVRCGWRILDSFSVNFECRYSWLTSCDLCCHFEYNKPILYDNFLYRSGLFL